MVAPSRGPVAPSRGLVAPSRGPVAPSRGGGPEQWTGGPERARTLRAPYMLCFAAHQCAPSDSQDTGHTLGCDRNCQKIRKSRLRPARGRFSQL